MTPASQSDLQTILDASADAIIAVDEQSRVLEWNKSAERIFGWRRKDALGRSIVALILSPEQRGRFKSGLKRFLRSAPLAITGYPHLLSARHKNGGTFPVEFAVARCATGVDPRFIAILRDVTLREETKRTLQQMSKIVLADRDIARLLIASENEQEFLQTVCNTIVRRGDYRLAWVGYKRDDRAKSVEVVSSAGPDKSYLKGFKVSWGNNTLGKGTTGTCLRTGKYSILSALKSSPANRPWSKMTTRLGFKAKISLPLKNKSGTFGCLNLYSCDPWAFSDEEVVYLSEMASDLAAGIDTLRSKEERDRYEEEMRRIQERMVQSEKLSAVGQIAAGVAHEVCNPLTVILGLAQALSTEETIPADAREHLALIAKHAARAGKISQGLLAFSRKRTPHKEPHDLREIVETTLPLVKHEFVKNNIRLKTVLGAQSAPSFIDAEQIQEILVNLIMNAVHAMEDRPKKTLDIRVERKAGRNLLHVRDSGRGIPKENLTKIFEPFFTTKPVGTGTGLGLSICYGIAEENGGRLSVESQPGTGTTFTLDLPSYL